MRIKIQTFRPLPPIKCWFDVTSVFDAHGTHINVTVADFIDTLKSEFGWKEIEGIVLEMDGFVLRKEERVEKIMRENDLIFVKMGNGLTSIVTAAARIAGKKRGKPAEKLEKVGADEKSKISKETTAEVSNKKRKAEVMEKEECASKDDSTLTEISEESLSSSSEESESSESESDSDNESASSSSDDSPAELPSEPTKKQKYATNSSLETSASKKRKLSKAQTSNKHIRFDESDSEKVIFTAIEMYPEPHSVPYIPTNGTFHLPKQPNQNNPNNQHVITEENLKALPPLIYLPSMNLTGLHIAFKILTMDKHYRPTLKIQSGLIQSYDPITTQISLFLDFFCVSPKPNGKFSIEEEEPLTRDFQCMFGELLDVRLMETE